MLRYQADLLGQLAERLDRRARALPWVFTSVGAVVGAGAGVFVTVFLVQGGGPVYPVVCAGALGALAYFLAHAKALALRLEVQAALCQSKIEEHTRPR